eukprot:jgi/Chrzof1/3646/Cz13g03190.t1
MGRLLNNGEGRVLLVCSETSAAVHLPRVITTAQHLLQRKDSRLQILFQPVAGDEDSEAPMSVYTWLVPQTVAQDVATLLRPSRVSESAAEPFENLTAAGIQQSVVGAQQAMVAAQQSVAGVERSVAEVQQSAIEQTAQSDMPLQQQQLRSESDSKHTSRASVDGAVGTAADGALEGAVQYSASNASSSSASSSLTTSSGASSSATSSSGASSSGANGTSRAAGMAACSIIATAKSDVTKLASFLVSKLSQMPPLCVTVSSTGGAASVTALQVLALARQQAMASAGDQAADFAVSVAHEISDSDRHVPQGKLVRYVFTVVRQAAGAAALP